MIAKCPQIWTKLIPQKEIEPAGAYEFRFFKNGEWTSVIIDDFIPGNCLIKIVVYFVVNDEGIPVFARSKDPNEMWVSLIEKAYAKLHKCYENLEGGSELYAFVDFTGGVPG